MDKPVVTDQPPPYSATMSGPAPEPHIHPASGVYVSPAPGQYPQPPPGTYPPPPPGTYPPPPPGYTPTPGPYVTTVPSSQGYLPNYGATNIIIPPPIIAVGACPACRVGVLEDDFTCLGIACAILFFPLGILCCLALKNRRCSNCGAMFG